jgi:hypothetical protein
MSELKTCSECRTIQYIPNGTLCARCWTKEHDPSGAGTIRERLLALAAKWRDSAERLKRESVANTPAIEMSMLACAETYAEVAMELEAASALPVDEP